MTEPTTKKLRFRLMVDFKDEEASKYRECRQKLTNTNLVQAAMEFLYEGLHGRTEAGYAKYVDLEGNEFHPDYTPYVETELPTWSDVVSLANEALTAYEGKGFGMSFKAIDESKGPHCVRWIHHEGRIEIEYNWDLAMATSSTSKAGWNRLPITTSDTGLPDDLQILQDESISCHYRLTATYGWVVGEEK